MFNRNVNVVSHDDNNAQHIIDVVISFVCKNVRMCACDDPLVDRFIKIINVTSHKSETESKTQQDKAKI